MAILEAEAPVARLPYRLDVADRVHEKEFVLGGRVGRDDNPGTEEAERFHQLDRERETQRVERVGLAQVVGGQGRIPYECRSLQLRLLMRFASCRSTVV